MQNNKIHAKKSRGSVIFQILLWMVALLVLVWVLIQVPIQEIVLLLGELNYWEIASLLLVNTAIILLFGVRWWLIIRSLGYFISFKSITRYRLAAFGVSYFTPGPHFGGEPLQVYFLRQRHGVPGTTAVASLALDKSFELLANFGFLVFGISVILSFGVLGALADTFGLWLALALLFLPSVYLVMLWRGDQPLAAILFLLPAARLRSQAAKVKSTEMQMNTFCREHPAVLLLSVVISGLVWMALIFEYWLALRFLGVQMDMAQIISIMTAARIALLTPFPGALGALEASQMLAMEALGYQAALGLGIGLLIRARDVLFGMLGLIWGVLIRN